MGALASNAYVQPGTKFIACVLASASAKLREQEFRKSCELWHNLDMPSSSERSTDPMDQLARSYSISESEELPVRELVEERPELFSALEALARHISRFFERRRLVLTAFVDPEEELPDTLRVSIQTDLAPADAVARRAKLYDQWWVPYILKHGDKSLIISLARLHDDV
jgi:hypothetical protein